LQWHTANGSGPFHQESLINKETGYSKFPKKGRMAVKKKVPVALLKKSLGASGT
jgi:hypothetical protein